MADNAPKLKKGDLLPIFIWGTLAHGDALKKISPEKQKSPGAFALSQPYAWMVVIVDDRCPAGKMNDARDTKLSVNVAWKQYEQVRELLSEGMAHVLIQAYAVADIKVAD